MNISNYLRNWCARYEDRQIDKDACNELRNIANRIDDEMVELPRDSDGVPVHVGDTVWGYASGIERVVTGISLTDKWTLLTDSMCIGRSTDVTHERPDSFERIADELDAMVGSAYFADDKQLADLANRIRKLANQD